ncbi:hypothetical protein K523DRAFT_367330 [Schizophyllum commune Tattone D]|nr:hypothetical protein K523DRAFT_367330 [Schizophyllum commune Tattone D]
MWFSRAPDRRRHARAPLAKDAGGVGHPLPSLWISYLPTASRRRRARAPSGKDVKEVGVPHPRAGQEKGAACPRVHNLGVICWPRTAGGMRGRPRHRMREGWGYPVPLVMNWPVRDPSAEDKEGLIFAGPKPPEASARTLGEGCEEGGVPLTPRGHGEIRTTRFSALHANAPTFKIPETDIFDERDPSPSSLPTSPRSTPTSQLSTTPIDASRCDPRDVANG